MRLCWAVLHWLIASAADEVLTSSSSSKVVAAAAAVAASALPTAKRKLPSFPADTQDGRDLLQHLLDTKASAASAASAAASQPTKALGLVVIPGLGRADRLETVIHNLRMLINGGHLVKRSDTAARRKRRASLWDCAVHVYADRRDRKNEAFFAETDKLAYVAQYCHVNEYPNQRVTTNMWTVKPWDVRSFYSYVFVLLDDIKLIPSKGLPERTEQTTGRRLTSSSAVVTGAVNSGNNKSARRRRKSFDLDGLLAVMARNNLTAASPMVVGANTGGGQAFRTIMQRPAQPGTLGYVSVFVELFAWIGTVPAYVALWEILYPSVNPFGWGHDFWYWQYGQQRVAHHRTGIVSTLRVQHEQDFSAPNGGRTDTTPVADKWGAVLAQEKFYKKHFGIDLKRCREKIGLSNTSWNGAVRGYLY